MAFISFLIVYSNAFWCQAVTNDFLTYQQSSVYSNAFWCQAVTAYNNQRELQEVYSNAFWCQAVTIRPDDWFPFHSLFKRVLVSSCNTRCSCPKYQGSLFKRVLVSSCNSICLFLFSASSLFKRVLVSSCNQAILGESRLDKSIQTRFGVKL